MTNLEIAGLLREYALAKNKTKEVRAEMMRVAVEELGLEQKEAQQANLETFLDGYLVGQGMMQSWRNIGA